MTQPSQVCGDAAALGRNKAYAAAMRHGDTFKAGPWAFKINVFHEHHDPEPRSTGWHIQDNSYELSTMLQGRMEYRLGGKEVELDAARGDWVLIPAGASHCRVCASAPALILGFLFGLECHRESPRSPSKLALEAARAGFHFPGEPGLSALRDAILGEADAALPLRGERISFLAREMLLLFFRGFFPGLAALPGEDARDDTMPALRLMDAFLEENIARAFRLEEVAASCGLSVRHANRLFARAKGVPLGQHVMDRKMALARKAVEERSRPIKEVALGLGYDDVSYFNRVFKKRFGATPTELRKRRSDPALC